MNFRAIQKLLSSCAFHPDRPGPMKVIMDVGGINYYLDRAVEMIRESQSPSLKPSEKWVLRQRAISLLAINILKDQENENPQGGQSKRGRKDGKSQIHQPEATQAAQAASVQSSGAGSGGDRPSGAADSEVRIQHQEPG